MRLKKNDLCLKLRFENGLVEKLVEKSSFFFSNVAPVIKMLEP